MSLILYNRTPPESIEPAEKIITLIPRLSPLENGFRGSLGMRLLKIRAVTRALYINGVIVN